MKHGKCHNPNEAEVIGEEQQQTFASISPPLGFDYQRSPLFLLEYNTKVILLPSSQG